MCECVWGGMAAYIEMNCSLKVRVVGAGGGGWGDHSELLAANRNEQRY